MNEVKDVVDVVEINDEIEKAVEEAVKQKDVRGKLEDASFEEGARVKIAGQRYKVIRIRNDGKVVLRKEV